MLPIKIKQGKGIQNDTKVIFYTEIVKDGLTEKLTVEQSLKERGSKHPAIWRKNNSRKTGSLKTSEDGMG